MTELEIYSTNGLSNILLRDNIICRFFKVFVCLYMQTWSFPSKWCCLCRSSCLMYYLPRNMKSMSSSLLCRKETLLVNMGIHTVPRWVTVHFIVLNCLLYNWTYFVRLVWLLSATDTKKNELSKISQGRTHLVKLNLTKNWPSRLHYPPRLKRQKQAVPNSNSCWGQTG